MGQLIQVSEFKEIIKPKIRGFWASGKDNFIGFSDREYFLPSNDEIKDFIAFNDSKIVEDFIPDTFDCDDYSFTTRGNSSKYFNEKFSMTGSFALGIAWGVFGWINEFHATNWIVNENKEFFWYEPQGHKLFQVNSCRKGLRLFLT